MEVWIPFAGETQSNAVFWHKMLEENAMVKSLPPHGAELDTMLTYTGEAIDAGPSRRQQWYICETIPNCNLNLNSGL